jgi:hypothetical protein
MRPILLKEMSPHELHDCARSRYIHADESSDGQTARSVCARRMQAMRLAARARYRALVAAGVVLPEAILFIGPEMLRGVKIEWPKEGRLLDAEPPPDHSKGPSGEP